MEYRLINDIMDFDNPIEFVLQNRGIEDYQHYLNTTEEDLYNPLLLKNMREGIKMLISNIAKKKKTVVVVDCDNDGYTSAALLLNYLNLSFPYFIKECVSYVFHESKTHGISDISFEEGTQFVIIPDASSSEKEFHKELFDKGIDVLVLDHHELDGMDEPYACIINNQDNDYPNKSLSGAGVVYKFCTEIDNLLGNNNAEKFRDLAMTGMIGDMMSLIPYETRHLVKTGLERIRNPFLKEIIKRNEYVIGDKVKPESIAFYVSPAINAITRVGTMEEKELLFRAMLETDAYLSVPSTKRGHKQGDTELIVEQAIRISNNVKNRQNQLRDELQNTIEELIEERNLLDNKILMILLEEGNKNLNGLVANRLMAKYQRPVLILIHNKEREEYAGSARGVNGSVVENFKNFCQNTGLTEYCQGHQGAFGFCIKESKIEEFISLTNELLKDVNFDIIYKVDYILDGRANPSKIILKIGELDSIWGQDVPESLIAIEDIPLMKDNIKLMKANTLKFIVSNNDVSFIKFNSSEEEYEDLLNRIGEGYITITAVGACNKNIWGGKVTPQIILEDYEITQEYAYCF